MDGALQAGPVLAVDHDRLFKELLTTFFAEFLDLFFPKLAAYLNRESIEFLPQEFFTNLLEGDEYHADIVVRARFKDEDAFFLIHVEHQSTAPTDFPRRFFRYYSAIFEKNGLPVYPIVIYSHDAPKKAQPNLYRVRFPDFEVLRFRYRVVQLNRLSWRKFIRFHNPVASALMAKMKVAERDRPKVKAECLRLMVTLKLDPARMRLIATFVDSYLRLNDAEEERFQFTAADWLPKERGLMEIITSWEQRALERGLKRGLEQGIEQGIEQGLERGRNQALDALRGTLLDVLAWKFGPLSDRVTSQVAGMNSIEDLRKLSHRALTASSLRDLGF